MLRVNAIALRTSVMVCGLGGIASSSFGADVPADSDAISQGIASQVATLSPSPTPSADEQILDSLRVLSPLPKVHYSWGLENGTLLITPGDPRLAEYVRITHAACVSGEWANEDYFDKVVRACAQVNATDPAIPATLGVNYSPWHRVFPADAPPTYMGPEHDLEISTCRDKMTNVRNLIAAANAKYGSDVTVSAVLLNSEVWEIKQPGEPDAEAWNAALDVKYNAIYDVAKSVFPGAIVIWVAEGSGPYFTLREKTDGFFNTTAYNPALPEINYPFMRDLLAFCERYGSSAAAMWISLASGYQIVSGAPTTYRYDWDYDMVNSWELGRRLNAPRLDGMAVPIQFICYWPAPFVTIVPAWGRHFVAYVCGAHGLPLPFATAGPNQTICVGGTTGGLGGNTPSVGTGSWSLIGGGGGTFSNPNDPNATFTHTGGTGPITLRWTTPNPPYAAPTADVVITIHTAAPTITQQPFAQSATSGQAVVFRVVASNSSPLRYRWRRNATDLADGGAVSGATTATLTIERVGVADTGNYDVVVLNPCASALSDPATLTVTAGGADLDGDGDVDTADFLRFMRCFNGPNRPPFQTACAEVDFDGDNDVDHADFLEFQNCFGGPNRAPVCP